MLVSELMLQQTTVATVVPRYAAFLERFPDLATLADAPLDDLLHAWQGLGYYRRARALHETARRLVRDHRGRMPDDVDGLRRLPGIGDYTAAAIAAIAFGRPVVPVDGNVRRVLARLAAIEGPIASGDPTIRHLAQTLSGGDRPGDLAQSVMELGAVHCRPRSPNCDACPWRSMCRARAAGRTEAIPAPARRAAKRRLFGWAYLLEREDGAVLLRKRPPSGLLAGMVELPGTAWIDRDEDWHPPTYGQSWSPIDGSVEHVFTHIALRMRVARGRGRVAPDGFWHDPARLGELALPTLTRKLLGHAGITRS